MWGRSGGPGAGRLLAREVAAVDRQRHVRHLRAWSEQSHTTAPAWSYGSAIEVAVGPGASALTRMPLGA